MNASSYHMNGQILSQTTDESLLSFYKVCIELLDYTYNYNTYGEIWIIVQNDPFCLIYQSELPGDTNFKLLKESEQEGKWQYF